MNLEILTNVKVLYNNNNYFHFYLAKVGGTENLRAYWQRYQSKALVLLYVVDSTDKARFTLAKKHLHELISSDPLLPLVVLANKQVNSFTEHVVQL